MNKIQEDIKVILDNELTTELEAYTEDSYLIEGKEIASIKCAEEMMRYIKGFAEWLSWNYRCNISPKNERYYIDIFSGSKDYFTIDQLIELYIKQL